MEEFIVEAFEIEDREALMDDIMTRYGQDVLRLTYSYVNSKELAEDLTQEIFIKCYKALHTYNGKSKLRTWLWRIAVNHCKDFLKSWYNKNVIVAEEEPTNHRTAKEMVEEAVIQKEEDDQLIAVVMTLPISYREVIYFYYYEELLIKEIAAVTEVSANTVKTRLRRAKELLKQRLEE